VQMLGLLIDYPDENASIAIAVLDRIRSHEIATAI